jgi:O-antigen/teichoic acid export membrane protein
MTQDSTSHEPRSVVRRALREGVSFGVLQGLGQVVLWGTNLLLARLLTPHDFGVYDILCFFIAIGAVFGDAGLGAALIRKADRPKARNTSPFSWPTSRWDWSWPSGWPRPLPS